MARWLTVVMTKIDVAPNEHDSQLAGRLERLNTRRAPAAATAVPDNTRLDSDLAGRLERLALRSGSPDATSTPAAPAPSKRRRHPARKSRYAALLLSLSTTGGLAAGFAALDGPSSSLVTAAGGIVPETSVSAPVTTAATSGLEPANVAAPVPVAMTTVNGDVYTNKWGPVQVQAIFAADGSLTSVDAIQSPSFDGKSVRINDRAVPVLNSEALATQQAQVDTVSGATYTSVDYERSLQSAIDAARSAGLTELA